MKAEELRELIKLKNIATRVLKKAVPELKVKFEDKTTNYVGHDAILFVSGIILAVEMLERAAKL
jgi:hypothetical protein